MTEGITRLILTILAALIHADILAGSMHNQVEPKQRISSRSSCDSNRGEFMTETNTDPTALVWRTQTAFSTILVITGAAELSSSIGSIVSSDFPGSLTTILANSLTARSTTSSQLSLGYWIPFSVLPMSLYEEGLSSTTIDMSPTPLIPTTSMETSISTAISYNAASSTQSSSRGAGETTSAFGQDNSQTPSTSLPTETSTTTPDGATFFSTTYTTTLAPPITATSSPSPSASPSTVVAPTFAPPPSPQTTLSVAAKSGIAISTAIALVLIGVLACLWRKMRIGETKQRKDLEATAIWVTRKITAEIDARPNHSGSTGSRNLKNHNVKPERATFLSEDARVARSWSEMDMTGGIEKVAEGKERVA